MAFWALEQVHFHFHYLLVSLYLMITSAAPETAQCGDLIGSKFKSPNSELSRKSESSSSAARGCESASPHREEHCALSQRNP